MRDRDADVADLQMADLQAQLATARSAADANSSTAEALHKLMSEMTDIRQQLDGATATATAGPSTDKGGSCRLSLALALSHVLAHF